MSAQPGDITSNQIRKDMEPYMADIFQAFFERLAALQDQYFEPLERNSPYSRYRREAQRGASPAGQLQGAPAPGAPVAPPISPAGTPPGVSGVAPRTGVPKEQNPDYIRDIAQWNRNVPYNSYGTQLAFDEALSISRDPLRRQQYLAGIPAGTMRVNAEAALNSANSRRVTQEYIDRKYDPTAQQYQEIKRAHEAQNISPNLPPVYGGHNPAPVYAQPGYMSGNTGPERLAALPDEMQEASRLINQNTGAFLPYLQQSQDQAQIAAQGFPDNRQRYMNPYMQDVVNRIREEGLRTFNERILPAMQNKFVRAGQHGGSKHADLTRRAARDIQDEILGHQAKAMYSGYGQANDIFNADQLRRIQQAENSRRLGSQLQAANLSDVAGLMDIGTKKQAHKQHGLDMAHADYLRQKDEPMVRLAQQAALMRGHNVPFTQNTYGYTPQNPQLNVPAQVGSLATQLLGATMRKRGSYVTRRRY